ncbi:MAG: beta-ketoacyl synthase N-terminal-like domain-containing protein [Candidatus Manganitrophaceae bacterium]
MMISRSNSKDTTGGERIAITGLGLVTPVGVTAWGSAASIRAGMTCFSESLVVRVAADRQGKNLCGATLSRVGSIPEALHGLDRAAALFLPPLREAVGGLPEDMMARAAWFIDHEICVSSEEDRGSSRQRWLARLRKEVPEISPILPENEKKADLGHGLFLNRTIQAVELLRSGEAEIVIVGAVDSLSTPPKLTELHRAGRLRSARHPEGIVPGEGTGVVVFETEEHARRRGASIFAYLTSWGSVGGEGLSQALHQALLGFNDKGEEIGLIVGDLTGERWRALEWSLTEQRLFPSQEGRRLWCPAEFVGDCGGATGVISLIIGTISLVKGYAPSRQVALYTSDQGGPRYVLRLSGGERFAPHRLRSVIFPEEKPIQSDNRAEEAATGRSVLSSLFETHLEEAEFLWERRETALVSHRERLSNLGEIEERLLAHLDGLAVGGKPVWDRLQPKWTASSAGEAFAAASVTLVSGEPARIDALFALFASLEGTGLVGIRQAFCHTVAPEAEERLQGWLSEKNNLLLSAAIDILGFRRSPIDRWILDRSISSSEPALVFSAVRAIGRLRIDRLKESVEGILDNEDPSLRAEAIWTGLLIGSKKAHAYLRRAVQEERGNEAANALRLLGFLGDPEDLPLMRDAVLEPGLSHSALFALGWYGHVGAIDLLIDRTKDPLTPGEWLRSQSDHSHSPSEVETETIPIDSYGAMIRLITGADLEKEGLLLPRTVGSEGERGEAPVLDWSRIGAWWKKRRKEYHPKVQYRYGLPRRREGLLQALQTAPLPDRPSVAYELALTDPSLPFLETAAFAVGQKNKIRKGFQS